MELELTPLVKYVLQLLIHLQENATLLLLLVLLPSLAMLVFTRVVVQAMILDVLRALIKTTALKVHPPRVV